MPTSAATAPATEVPTLVPTLTATPTNTATPTATPVPVVEWLAEGDQALAQSDMAAAEAAYRRVLEYEESAPAYARLARLCWWTLGRSDETLANAEKAVALAPDDAQAHAALARGYLDALDTGKAIASSEKAVSLAPEDAYAQAVLAEAYLIDNQYDNALAAASQAVALDDTLADAYYALASCYRNMADPGRALAAIDKAIALQPSFEPWLTVKARLMTDACRYTDAAALYSRARLLRPDALSPILDLARLQMDQGRYDQAEALVVQLLSRAPDLALAHIAQGDLLLKQDKTEEALVAYREALAKEPGSWTAQVALGYGLLAQKEYEAATAQFQKAAEGLPNWSTGYLGLGYAKLSAGDVGKALEYFRQALDHDRYSTQAYVGLGRAYAQQERWDDATEALVRALELAPGKGAIHTELGYTFLAQGNADAAMLEFELALAQDALQAGAHVGLCAPLIAAEEYAEAQIHAEQAVALDPTAALAKQWLAIALLEQNKPLEASQLLEEVLADDPENGVAHYHLGLAYRDLGKFSQAAEELNTHLKLTPDEVESVFAPILARALAEGYSMTEAKALSDIKSAIQQLTNGTVTAKVQERAPGGRTLVMTFQTTTADDEDDVLSVLVMAIGYSMPTAMRITPPLGLGGLVAEARRGGTTQMEVTLTLDAAQRIADGRWPLGALFETAQVSRVVAKGAVPLTEIKAGVRAARELDAKTAVTYKILKPEEMDAQLRDEMASIPDEAVFADAALLSLLGLIDPAQDLQELAAGMRSTNVLGYYSPIDKALYVEQAGKQGVDEEIVTAHEYTHALQDQHFDLTRLTGMPGGDDGSLAFRALVEGDATLATLTYADENVVMTDRWAAMSEAGGYEEKELYAAPLFIREMQLFAYEAGLAFVQEAYNTGGWEGVNAMYDQPPVSTEQVLHPARYREGDLPVAVSLDPVKTTPGADWEVLDVDTLGEVGLRLAAAQLGGAALGEAAGEGWGGDAYLVLRQGDAGALALVVRTEWDTLEEANEFWELYRVVMAHRSGYVEQVSSLTGELSAREWSNGAQWVRLHKEGSGVTLLVGPSKETVAALAEAL